MRGVWIEMTYWDTQNMMQNGSLPMRGVWIEIGDGVLLCRKCKSLPMRGVWIEILVTNQETRSAGVTPHAEITGFCDKTIVPEGLTGSQLLFNFTIHVA